MALNALLPTVEWHEKLAEIHASEANLSTATQHETEATKLEKQAQESLASRKALVRLKAKPLIVKANRHKYLAQQVKSEPDAVAQLKHELVAAQLKAVAEGKNPTLAANKVFQKLMAEKNPAMLAAIAKHPTAKILGIV